MRRRRKRNGAISKAIAVSTVQAAAPLLPVLALLGVGYWAWKKYLSSGATAAAAQVARTAGDVAQGYGQAANYAAGGPDAWRRGYEDAQRTWTGGDNQGSPAAQPYYGPAGAWTGGDYGAGQ